jgi:uncharacterized protein (TIGR02246 family)
MRRAVVLGLLLATAAPALAQGQDDEAAIRRIIQSAAGSDDAIAADVMFTNIFGSVYRGRKEYVERHQYLFSELFKGATSGKASVQRIYFVRPDVALVLVESVITGLKYFPPGPALTPDGTLRTIGLRVFTKEQGRWITQAWHNTDVKPQVPGAR